MWPSHMNSMVFISVGTWVPDVPVSRKYWSSFQFYYYKLFWPCSDISMPVWFPSHDIMFILGHRDSVHVFIVEMRLVHGWPGWWRIQPDIIPPSGPNSINNYSPSQSSFVWNYSCCTVSCVLFEAVIRHSTPGVCFYIVLPCSSWLLIPTNHINKTQYLISNSTMSSKLNITSC